MLLPTLIPPPEKFCFEWTVRLYLVVLGRPPDSGGLQAYMRHLHDGRTLVEIADELIKSAEFRDKAKSGDGPICLYRHAGVVDAKWPTTSPVQSLAELAVQLVLEPEIKERLPVLPALYPDGVPWASADYRLWLLGRPNLTSSGNLGRRGDSPTLSIVMLLDEPRLVDLAAAIRSVLKLDAAVELVLAAPLPFPKVILHLIRDAYGPELPIKVVRCVPWSSRASQFNRALKRCSGTFVALIGQHDLIDSSLATIPSLDGAEIVLTDDDELGQTNERGNPRLTTSWDPDKIIASDYSGLILFRTALVRAVGGMRRAWGREEWALLLNAASAVPEAAIHHVSIMALSRRDIVPTTARPLDAGVAMQYLRKSGETANVTVEAGRLRVTYPLAKPPPLVSIIIPTKDRADLLRRCMAGLLRRTNYEPLEIVIVDNGSTAEDAVALLAELQQDERVRILSVPGAFNWSELNNAGVKAMRGEVALLLNNDTDVLESDWLRELVSHAMRPTVGIVGAKLLYGDGTVQHAGVVLGPNGRAGHMWRFQPGDEPGYLNQLAVTRRVSALTGACLAIRREIYEMVGGCDAVNLPVTWNDVDLCLRVRALGLHAIWTPHARLLHLEQATRGTDDTPENHARFLREQAWMRKRWGGMLDHDPFRNPNLLPSEKEMRLSSHFD